MSTLPEGIIRTPEGVHVLKADSHLSRWVEQAGRLDIAEAEIAHFAGHIPEGGVVLDAGACIGDHTATYAKLVGPLGKVIAIEPGELAYQALWRNFQDVPQVATIHAALGAHEGETCHVMAENVGGSHIGNDGPPNVALTTIDALRLPRLDFVHLDAEGMEPDILRGGRETLKRFMPVMVIEINKGALARFGHKDEDVYRILDELGYGWREMFDHCHAGMEQRDIIAIRK
jgi:FkbM family methyltransferase